MVVLCGCYLQGRRRGSPPHSCWGRLRVLDADRFWDRLFHRHYSATHTPPRRLYLTPHSSGLEHIITRIIIHSTGRSCDSAVRCFFSSPPTALTSSLICYYFNLLLLYIHSQIGNNLRCGVIRINTHFISGCFYINPST